MPVEPPEALSDRLERGLTEITEVAAAELADWELSAMSDPRNWAPGAAVVVGSVAAGGLVLVRARQQQKKRQATGLRALEKSMRGVADDIEKRLKEEVQDPSGPPARRNARMARTSAIWRTKR